jgi:hypothetical protein
MDKKFAEEDGTTIFGSDCHKTVGICQCSTCGVNAAARRQLALSVKGQVVSRFRSLIG